MAAKTANLIKYLIKGKETRKKTLQKEMHAVDAKISNLKKDLTIAVKREAAALAAKKKKKR
jgi:hypothetical protein